jgi:hypothetical protein
VFDRPREMTALLLYLALVGSSGGVGSGFTGTWQRGDPENGGGVVRVEQKDSTVRFQLECWRGAPSYGSGFVEGAFRVSEGKGVFRAEGEGWKCELEFVFSAESVRIESVGDAPAQCGFGYGVRADGVYELESQAVPEFCHGDCRDGE